MRVSFKDQVRSNIVAIISLLLAILGLSYNTWRNEITEHNRNVRQAGVGKGASGRGPCHDHAIARPRVSNFSGRDLGR